MPSLAQTEQLWVVMMRSTKPVPLDSSLFKCLSNGTGKKKKTNKLESGSTASNLQSHCALLSASQALNAQHEASEDELSATYFQPSRRDKQVKKSSNRHLFDPLNRYDHRVGVHTGIYCAICLMSLSTTTRILESQPKAESLLL